MKTLESLKVDITQAVKERDQIKSSILKLVYSECERTGSTVEKISEKLIESNDETLKYRENDKLTRENEILKTLVPKKISQGDILMVIMDSSDKIKEGSEGQAVGIAMKILKEKGLTANGADVKIVVQRMRS
jgi:uncharacterized protein YqeY